MATTMTDTKRNELIVDGADRISLRTPKGTIGGMYWDGSALGTRIVGGSALSAGPVLLAEIAQAVAAHRPAIMERATGAQIVDGDRDGWTLDAIEGDAVGHYVRVADAGTGPVSVWFGKADLA